MSSCEQDAEFVRTAAAYYGLVLAVILTFVAAVAIRRRRRRLR